MTKLFNQKQYSNCSKYSSILRKIYISKEFNLKFPSPYHLEVKLQISTTNTIPGSWVRIRKIESNHN